MLQVWYGDGGIFDIPRELPSRYIQRVRTHYETWHPLGWLASCRIPASLFTLFNSLQTPFVAHFSFKYTDSKQSISSLNLYGNYIGLIITWSPKWERERILLVYIDQSLVTRRVWNVCNSSAKVERMQSNSKRSSWSIYHNYINSKSTFPISILVFASLYYVQNSIKNI